MSANLLNWLFHFKPWLLGVSFSTFALFTVADCSGLNSAGTWQEDSNVPSAAAQIRIELASSPQIQLKNWVKFSANVTGTGSTYSVRFYMNDELLGETSLSPHELLWDSTTVNDDTYTFGAVATVDGREFSDEKTLSTHNAAARKFGLNFNPHEGNQDPRLNSPVSKAQIRRKLSFLRHFTDKIRTFGTSPIANLNAIPAIADEFNFCVALGIWLDKDLQTNQQEIDLAIESAQQGCVHTIVVGNETLLRGDLTEDELIAYIQQVQQKIPGVQVTTAEIYPNWLSHPNLVAAVDIIYANIYAYWEGVREEVAVAATRYHYMSVKNIAQGKEVVISEVGFPFCGDRFGNAVPSPENARKVLLEFVTWAERQNIEFYYFSSQDEPWKVREEGAAGGCWGLRDQAGVLKPGVAQIHDGVESDDTWSAVDTMFPGGPGVPTIEFTYVPNVGSHENVVGQALHMNRFTHDVVLYISVGNPPNWWIKPTAAQARSRIVFDGTFIVDYTTGGADDEANAMYAFLIPDSYDPPILRGAPSIPQELLEKALAYTLVTRP